VRQEIFFGRLCRGSSKQLLQFLHACLWLLVFEHVFESQHSEGQVMALHHEFIDQLLLGGVLVRDKCQ
jgi:hypothetical protein